MKRVLLGFLTALTCAVPVQMCADEQAEHKLADAAYAVGDYTNAVSGYRSAMQLADRAGDQEKWARNALKLADAMLRSGDLNGARTVYGEFRRRNPLRSAGTLPGDLLAAEGKYSEADKFLTALANSSPELADAALFSRGMVQMRAGNVNEAYKLFAKLAKQESPWAEPARYEAVYALIHLDKSGEALAELGNVPVQRRNSYWDMFRFMAEAYSGKTSELKKTFTAFIEKQPPVPPVRLMELLAVAANAAAAQQDHQFAAELINAALAFDIEPSVKQELSRRLINIYAVSDPMRSAAEARQYAVKFPEAHDRGEVLNATGRMLAAKNKPQEAIKIFAFVAQAPDYLLADRLAAAAEMVATVTASGEKNDLVPFYTLLGNASETPSGRSMWRSRFAEFLERNGDRSGALREYQRALQAAPAAESEKAHFQLLNFFIRTGNDSGIRKEADFLSGAKDTRFRSAAKFELGRLAEKSGKYAEARKFYRESGMQADSQVALKAKFQAALLTFRLKEYAAAGKELQKFAAAYAKSPLAANALYYAVESFRRCNDREEAAKTAAQLRKVYPKSEAAAFLLLDEAQERAQGRDYAGAIAELERLEEDFAGEPIVAEATLLKAVLMTRQGLYDEALKSFKALTVGKVSPEIAAESAVNAGEILFSREDFKAARDMFLLGAKLNPGGLFADIATGRAVDCALVRRGTPDPASLQEATVRCEQLAADTVFPQIRLQALYKLGMCRESAGDYELAVQAYERLLYAAEDIAGQGVLPEAQWCIRGTEAALRLLIRYRMPGALQRGIKLITRLDALRLPGISGTALKKDFREQLKNTRRK